jgi:hypothetical protein
MVRQIMNEWSSPKAAMEVRHRPAAEAAGWDYKASLRRLAFDSIALFSATAPVGGPCMCNPSERSDAIG